MKVLGNDDNFREYGPKCSKFIEKYDIYGGRPPTFNIEGKQRIKTFTGNQDLRYGREDSNPKNHIGEDNGLDDFIKSHGSDSVTIKHHNPYSEAPDKTDSIMICHCNLHTNKNLAR